MLAILIIIMITTTEASRCSVQSHDCASNWGHWKGNSGLCQKYCEEGRGCGCKEEDFYCNHAVVRRFGVEMEQVSTGITARCHGGIACNNHETCGFVFFVTKDNLCYLADGAGCPDSMKARNTRSDL